MTHMAGGEGHLVYVIMTHCIRKSIWDSRHSKLVPVSNMHQLNYKFSISNSKNGFSAQFWRTMAWSSASLRWSFGNPFLTFSFQRWVAYGDRTRLPILHAMECLGSSLTAIFPFECSLSIKRSATLQEMSSLIVLQSF